MRLRFTDVYLGVESEGEVQTQVLSQSSEKYRSESIYAVPTLGLGLQGSFYHPNLAYLTLTTEDGVGWQQSSFTGPDGGTKTEPMYLVRYLGELSLLKEKPYVTTLFASRDHTTRDYDFFTRATVDAERYGGRMGYSEGPVPVSLSVAHSTEDISGSQRPTSFEETLLSFSAKNQRRAADRTDLSYRLSDFSRHDIGFFTQEGLEHTVNLFDTENFGTKDRASLQSSLLYDQVETTTTPESAGEITQLPTSALTLQEHLTLKHSKPLQSDYNYNFDTRSSGPVDSDGQLASVALRHQLYESLTSTFDVHGQVLSSSGGGTSLDTTRYGVGLAENYSKRLGQWGKLTLGYNGLLDKEERTSSGPLVVILGEAHPLTDATPAVLNQPYVNLSSIRVTDSTGAIQYREILDYQVVPRGALTEIRRVVGGLIPNGTTILVDYTALSQPSDSYTTFGNQFYVRLNLFGDWLGLYGRLNFLDHYGGDTLVLQDIAESLAGIDVSSGWGRAGAEYDDFRSNLSPYTALRLFQGLTLEPREGTAFSLDFSQSWTEYPDTGEKMTIYSFIGRTRVRVSSHLTVNAEGGVRVQRGNGYDQNLGTARAGLDFSYGKLTCKVGYEFEDEVYMSQWRQRHFFSVRARRTF